MNCPGCHAEVSPGAKFCGRCGARLEVAEEAAGVPVATPSVPVAASGDSGADAAVPGGDGSGAGTPVFHQAPHGPAAANGNFGGGGYAAATGFTATSGGASAGGYAAPTGYAAAPQGCLGAAWHDITSSPGWVKRVLLLMVMNCVPVLNFFAKGYNLQWGAQAARGERHHFVARMGQAGSFADGDELRSRAQLLREGLQPAMGSAGSSW